MPRTSSTLKLRIYYTIELLKEFNALTLHELAKFHEVSARMMSYVLRKMQEENLLVKQLKRYKLTDIGKGVSYLHELYFI